MVRHYEKKRKRGRLSVIQRKALFWSRRRRSALTKEGLEDSRAVRGEIPFDAERKMMTIIRRTADGSMAYVKGAPDVLFPAAHIVGPSRVSSNPWARNHSEDHLDINASLAQQALRVLAVAHRRLDGHGLNLSTDVVEKNLVFLGFVCHERSGATGSSGGHSACRTPA